MKTKFTFCLMLLLMGMTANLSAQNNASDTLVVEKPQRVTILSNDNTYQVKIEGSEANPNYRYNQQVALQGGNTTVIQEYNQEFNLSLPFTKKQKKCNHNTLFLGGFGVGFVNALDAPQGMNVNMGASYEIMLMHALGYLWRPWDYQSAAFSIGVGINWKNFRMTGRQQFLKENSDLIISNYPENANINYSRLKIFSWTVPIMYQQHLHRDLDIAFGPVLNFNTYGSLSTKYRLDGQKQSFFDKNIHQNPVTVDLMANLYFKYVGFYFKYSPTKVLDTEFGPSFKSLSAGFIFFY